MQMISKTQLNPIVSGTISVSLLGIAVTVTGVGEGVVTVVELDTANAISKKYTCFTFGLL